MHNYNSESSCFIKLKLLNLSCLPDIYLHPEYLNFKKLSRFVSVRISFFFTLKVFQAQFPLFLGFF